MSKPREWALVHIFGNCFQLENKDEPYDAPIINVIEKSAYDQLREHVELLTTQCADLDADKANLEAELDEYKSIVISDKPEKEWTIEDYKDYLIAQRTKLMELAKENVDLKARNWVLKDSALRTYDGLADKADKLDKIIKVLNEQ